MPHYHIALMYKGEEIQYPGYERKPATILTESVEWNLNNWDLDESEVVYIDRIVVYDNFGYEKYTHTVGEMRLTDGDKFEVRDVREALK